MKIMIQVCKKCGYKEEVKIYDREEVRKLRLNPVRPWCKKCGSPEVELK